MAVKRKISKAEYEALSDDKKSFYVENTDRRGEYVIDMDADFNKDLNTALETLKTENKTLKTQLEESTVALDTEKKKKQSVDGSVSKDDHEAMKASYESKLTAAQVKANETIARKDGFIRKTLIDSKALELATKISKAPALMARVIKERLSANLDGDEPATIVLDKDGKPSAFTLDDLSQELVANKEFADIVLGSKATGGNALNVPAGGNALQSDKPVNLSSLQPAQLVEHMRATHPELSKS